MFVCTESENRRCSQGVVCRCHQAIFFILIYFRLFALFWKNKYIFQYYSKKSLNSFIGIDRNYLFGSFEITPIRLYTPLCKLRGVYDLIEVISSWTEQKLRSILNKIGICCFSAKQAALIRIMCPEWNNMSTRRGLLRFF